mgnify:CR=1 FL=1
MIFPWGGKKAEPVTEDVIEKTDRMVSGEGRLEVHSLTWAFVVKWANDEIGKARENNDSMRHDTLQTSALRGRIKTLKELIDLPLPPKRDRQKIKKEEEDY